MLEHGGRLQSYAQKYGIAAELWLDLSTGINPDGWPVPVLPDSVWSRLPEPDDGLSRSAQAYYQCNDVLPVAGSQVAIQVLPTLRPACRVGILSPCYAEHGYHWQQAGHHLVQLEIAELDRQLDDIDVLIIINPNNPTGRFFTPEQLLKWHERLARRNGWLVVDEAFIDVTPELSLAAFATRPGLIILRSLGKFFGLAGLRVGFVIAEPALLAQIDEKMGPWPIASASRFLAQKALADFSWQQQARQHLRQQQKRLHALLAQHGLTPDGGCGLFQWLKTDKAVQIHHMLAQAGILTRLFEQPASLRFGLAGSEEAWQRLDQILCQLEKER